MKLLLLVERKAKLVGMDTFNADDRTNPHRPCHSELLKRDILIVENLTNLSLLAQQQGQQGQQANCSLMVDALMVDALMVDALMVDASNHVAGTGGPARVMTACQGGQTEKDKFRHKHR